MYSFFAGEGVHRVGECPKKLKKKSGVSQNFTRGGSSFVHVQCKFLGYYLFIYILCGGMRCATSRTKDT